MSPATFAISVVLCTHNPRQDYLSRTVDALRGQTLGCDQWELLIIDNGSTPPIAPNLSWHPSGRLFREESIGLTYARICGIEHAYADLLIFVDDDNLLAPDYLARVLEIARKWTILGVWGAQCWPDFERTPDDWAREYWTPRDFTHDRWSNLPELSSAMPSGGGMCVRRCVAEAYVTQLKNDPARRMLDRAGNQLLSACDRDLSLTACDLGLGNGVFSALKLIHLIPARRLEEGYLLRLVEGMACSRLLLKYFRGQRPFRRSRSQRLLHWYQSLHLSARERRFEAARQRGIEAALREVERLEPERLYISSD